MKHKLLAILLLLFLALSVSSPVQADMGPKASLVVHIKGCTEEYSFELLTYEPYLKQDEMPYDYTEPYSYYKDDYPDFFYTYLDDDQYAAYTLYSIPGSIQQESTHTYLMNYIAPRVFKIALYMDDSDILIVSEIIDTTLFESEVTWDLTGEQFDTSQEGIGTVSGTIVGDPEGRVWTKTLVQTLIRVVVTVTVELGILLLFGVRRKDLLIKVGIVNIITQTVLSAVVISTYLVGGALAYILFLFLGEFLVVIAELIACLIIFKGTMPVWKTFIYVILANLTTMIIGVNILLLFF